MSLEREVESPSGATFKYAEGMTKEEIKRGLHVEVLDRGRMAQRLDMSKHIPADVHGEWIHKDDILEMQEYGFEVDRIYGKAKSLHNDGTDRTQTGDVVFMTCPKIVKEAIDEARHDAYIKRHGKPGQNKQAVQEEREFISEARRAADGSHIDFFGQSETNQIDGETLKSTLNNE